MEDLYRDINEISLREDISINNHLEFQDVSVSRRI